MALELELQAGVSCTLAGIAPRWWTRRYSNTNGSKGWADGRRVASWWVDNSRQEHGVHPDGQSE